MSHIENEFVGNITSVRAVEDCIRITQKYTEGVGTLRNKHPIQGEDFPSKSFCKYYEVYPDVKVSWDMPVGVAIDWLWHEYDCIDVVFKYDYRVNKATVIIKDGVKALEKLRSSIPNFRDTLANIINGHERVKPQTG